MTAVLGHTEGAYRVLPSPSGDDDHEALQAAIDGSLPGDTITAHGTDAPYLLGSTLRLKPNRRYVFGTSHTSLTTPVTFKMADGANLDAVVASEGWYENGTAVDEPLTFEGCLIDGNKTNQASGQGDGLVLMNWRSTIRNVQVKNAGGNAFRLTAKNSAGTTISSTAVENRLVACVADSCDERGFYIEDPSGKLTDGWLIDCIVANSAGDAVRMERSAGWLISGCHIYGTVGGNAISLSYPLATRVTGNYIEDFGRANVGTSYFGILLASATGDRANIVQGNTVNCNEGGHSSSTYQCYRLSAGSSATARFVVIGNQATGANGASKTTGFFWTISSGGTNYGHIAHNEAYKCAAAQVANNSSGGSDNIRAEGNSWQYATAAPTTGYWPVGTKVWNTAVAAGGSPGWVCTTAGTPGTWKAMASVAA